MGLLPRYEGMPGDLRVVADYWFQDSHDLVAGVTEGDWDVEWLPRGHLMTRRSRPVGSPLNAGRLGLSEVGGQLGRP